MTQNEMIGWHYRLDGHEFEQAPGDGEGQGSLARCSLWGCRVSDTTERLNNNFMEGVSQVALLAKELPANAGDVRDLSLIPGSGRFL